MGVMRRYVIGLAAIWAALAVPAGASAADRVTLRESARVGETTRVEVNFSARGEFREEPAAGGAAGEAQTKGREGQAKGASSYPLKTEVQLEFWERVVKAGEAGGPALVARRARKAASAVNVGARSFVTSLRP